MSENLEDQGVLNAYQSIAQEIMAFIGDNPWDEAGAKYGVFYKMIRSGWWRKDGDIMDKMGVDIPEEVSKKAREGIYYLRKHLIELTGDRIWGLTFTLYPSGKFNIEYDYNKPESHNEADEPGPIV